MSDDDRDIDVESDEDDEMPLASSDLGATQFMTQAEKRAHHNALERKRRDHIKESFSSLRDSIPSLQGEKVSRAEILKKSTDYIQFMRNKNNSFQSDIDDLKRQNNVLEQQVRSLEKAKSAGQYASASAAMDSSIFADDSASESSDTETLTQGRRKKQKTK